MKYITPLVTLLLAVLGIAIFKDRQYYFISIAIIIVLLVPAVFSLEKINTRRLVLIGALAALAAVSRVAFAPIQQFKPIAAVVILSGIGLGAQSGFAVGAVGIFASNMYFSQGPWTPWQMLALGLVGYISGLLFAKRRVNTFLLAVYGFLVTAVVYGVIMDSATAVMTYGKPTLAQLWATLALGVYFNVVHGLSSFVFILVLGGKFIKRLDRIVVKYGI
jgi:energy-coupling factor transport system substrate-specific component